MPTTRTLQILNGPDFQGFALANGIVTGSWSQTFLMDKEIPEDFTIYTNKKLFQMTLKLFGDAPDGVKNNFTFVAFMSLRKYNWFYVGTYSTATRKGQCTETVSEEFFKSDFAKQLFPNLIPRRLVMSR